MSENFVKLQKSAVSERRAARIQVSADLAIAVFQRGDQYFAINDRCPHQGVSFAGGAFNGTFVICPGHGFKIDARTGRCPQSPYLRVETFAVSDAGDELAIDLGDRAPG